MLHTTRATVFHQPCASLTLGAAAPPRLVKTGSRWRRREVRNDWSRRSQHAMLAADAVPPVRKVCTTSLVEGVRLIGAARERRPALVDEDTGAACAPAPTALTLPADSPMCLPELSHRAPKNGLRRITERLRHQRLCLNPVAFRRIPRGLQRRRGRSARTREQRPLTSAGGQCLPNGRQRVAAQKHPDSSACRASLRFEILFAQRVETGDQGIEAGIDRHAGRDERRTAST